MTDVAVNDVVATLTALHDRFWAERTTLEATHERFAPDALAYRAEQEREADAAYNGSTYTIDPEVARAGVFAHHEVETAITVVGGAHAAFVAAFRAAVMDGALAPGMTVPSPFSTVPLTVIDVWNPTGEFIISEVSLTADGGPAYREFHTWPVDSSFRPVVDPDPPVVRFERWGVDGIRVGGTVHAVTRRIVNVDA